MPDLAAATIKLPGAYAAVVFDLDGLLVQTEKLWSEAKDTLFSRHQVEYSDADHLAVFGTSDIFTATYFTRRFGAASEEMESIRSEYMAIASGLFEQGVEIGEGAVALVERLSSMVPLALATNTRRPQVETILASTPFAEHFAIQVTGDDGTPKPAPDLYLLACTRLGVDPSRSVALEDSPTGVAAAKAAGLTCIGVPSHPDERLAQADAVIESLAELLQA
ncbi:MAG: HAD family hydrolase [Chloroflexota bacterium]